MRMNVLVIGNSMGYQCYHYLPMILNRCGKGERIHFEALYMRGARLWMQLAAVNSRLTECINPLDKEPHACNVLYKYVRGNDKLECTKMPDITITELIHSRKWDVIFVVPNTDCLYKDDFKETLKKYVEYVRSQAPGAQVGYIQPTSEYTSTDEVLNRLYHNESKSAGHRFKTVKDMDSWLDAVEKDVLEYCGINLVLHNRRIFNAVKHHPKMRDKYEMTHDLHHVDDCLGLYVMSLITYYDFFAKICPCPEENLYLQIDRPKPNHIDGTPARSVTKTLARRAITIIKRYV